MKFETTKWKEYTVSDYFDVYLSSGDLKIDDCEPGNIPLVSSGSTNNGIVGYIDEKGDGKAQIFKANSITVDMFCNAFYQSKDFYAVSHGRVNILSPKFECNLQIGLFICSIIKKEQFKYSYGRAVYSSEIARMIIKLPSKLDGTPDWNFMEQYIKSLNHKPLATANQGGYGSHTLGVDSWIEYEIGDIFDISNGKGITKEEIEENPGNLIAVQSGEENNGCIGKIDETYCKDMNYTFTNEPCLTVARSGSAGFVSFQSKGCVVGDSAKILTLKKTYPKNTYIYIFLRTVLMANKYKYTYGRKVTEDKYMSEKIKLPSAPNGYPDFLFMENYIKSLPYGDKI